MTIVWEMRRWALWLFYAVLHPAANFLECPVCGGPAFFEWTANRIYCCDALELYDMAWLCDQGYLLA